MYKAITLLLLGILFSSCSLVQKKDTYNLGIFLSTISGLNMVISLKSNGTITFTEKNRNNDSGNKKYSNIYLKKDNKIITYSIITPNEDEPYNLITGVGYFKKNKLIYANTSLKYEYATLPENCDNKTFNEIHTVLSSGVDFLTFSKSLSLLKITGWLILIFTVLGLVKKKNK